MPEDQRHQCCCVLGGKDSCKVVVVGNDKPLCDYCEMRHAHQSNFTPRIKS